MIYASLSVICVLFVELSILLKLNDAVKSLFSLSRQAFGVITSKELSDLEKEVMIRQAFLDVLKVTSVFIFKFVVILLVLYSAYLLFAIVLPFSEQAFVDSLYSIEVIVLLTLVAVVYFWLRNVIVQRLLSD